MDFLYLLTAATLPLLLLAALGCIPLFVGVAQGKLGAGVFWFLATPTIWIVIQIVAGMLGGIIVAESGATESAGAGTVLGLGVAGVGSCAGWLAAFFVPAYGTYSILAPARRARARTGRRRSPRTKLASAPGRAQSAPDEQADRIRFCAGCKEAIPWEDLHCRHCGHEQRSATGD